MIKRLKEKLRRSPQKVVISKSERKGEGSSEEEYIELAPEVGRKTSKIFLKYSTLTDFSDITPILNSLREGLTIQLIKIKPLKDKDINELKRAIAKIKKTINVVNGDIVGVDEDYLIAAPNFVEIGKTKKEE